MIPESQWTSVDMKNVSYYTAVLTAEDGTTYTYVDNAMTPPSDVKVSVTSQVGVTLR